LRPRDDGLLRAHLGGALASGDFDVTALRQLALHVGLYVGMPVALAIDAAVTDVAADHPSRSSGDVLAWDRGNS
jgi:hypothetical protein